jgi:hypothetical protein
MVFCGMNLRIVLPGSRRRSLDPAEEKSNADSHLLSVQVDLARSRLTSSTSYMFVIRWRRVKTLMGQAPGDVRPVPSLPRISLRNRRDFLTPQNSPGAAPSSRNFTSWLTQFDRRRLSLRALSSPLAAQTRLRLCRPRITLPSGSRYLPPRLFLTHGAGAHDPAFSHCP